MADSPEGTKPRIESEKLRKDVDRSTIARGGLRERPSGAAPARSGAPCHCHRRFHFGHRAREAGRYFGEVSGSPRLRRSPKTGKTWLVIDALPAGSYTTSQSMSVRTLLLVLLLSCFGSDLSFCQESYQGQGTQETEELQAVTRGASRVAARRNTQSCRALFTSIPPVGFRIRRTDFAGVRSFRLSSSHTGLGFPLLN